MFSMIVVRIALFDDPNLGSRCAGRPWYDSVLPSGFEILVVRLPGTSETFA